MAKKDDTKKTGEIMPNLPDSTANVLKAIAEGKHNTGFLQLEKLKQMADQFRFRSFVSEDTLKAIKGFQAGDHITGLSAAVNTGARWKSALDQLNLDSLNTTSKAIREWCESATRSMPPISERFAGLLVRQGLDANLSSMLEACKASLSTELVLASSRLQNSAYDSFLKSEADRAKRFKGNFYRSLAQPGQQESNADKMLDDIGKRSLSFAPIPSVPTRPRQEDKPLPLNVNININGDVTKENLDMLLEQLREEEITINIHLVDEANEDDEKYRTLH